MPSSSILVTGCSSGIGLHSALLLKKQGYRVFATTRKIADMEKLSMMGLESIPLDVTNPTSIKNCLEQILTLTQGQLTALFNNAGFLVAGAIEDLTLELIKTQFATNVFGPMELIRQILPIMRRQGHGRIIQNSSILGLLTLPYYGAYNASKFALEGFSKTLRQELHGTNIHVSIINPGPIHSKLREHAYEVYQQNLARQKSIHHKNAYAQLEKSYFHPDKKNRKIMLPPDAIFKSLLHALESKHPKPHYYIGFPIKLLVFLKRILPENLFDYLLMSI